MCGTAFYYSQIYNVLQKNEFDAMTSIIYERERFCVSRPVLNTLCLIDLTDLSSGIGEIQDAASTRKRDCDRELG